MRTRGPIFSTVLVFACTVLLLGCPQHNSVNLVEYFPTDPDVYGTRTYEWMFGVTGKYISTVVGTQTVPYTSGALMGTLISNAWPSTPPKTSDVIIRNNGSSVDFLGDSEGYVSTDCDLTAHFPGYSWSIVYDNTVVETGPFSFVSRSDNTCEKEDVSTLFRVANVTVRGVTYENAVVFWGLDQSHFFKPLDMEGFETGLGIKLPTLFNTHGVAVTDFGIYAKGIGLIAGGDVDAASGRLTGLVELRSVD